MTWGGAAAIVVAALLVAGAILLMGRWQIVASPNTDAAAVYRLDRWTGHVELCGVNHDVFVKEKRVIVTCPIPVAAR